MKKEGIRPSSHGFFISLPRINKITYIKAFFRALIKLWGTIRDSNPCITEPQSAVLTPSPIVPNNCVITDMYNSNKFLVSWQAFFIFFYKLVFLPIQIA